jgi:DNA-binding IclR family transcriptional regulator
MAALLDIIRGELADARKRVDQLERMEHLAIALEGDVGEDTGTSPAGHSSPAGAAAVGTAAGVLPPATQPDGPAGSRAGTTAETGPSGRTEHQEPARPAAGSMDSSAPGTATPPLTSPRYGPWIDAKVLAAVRELGPSQPRALAKHLELPDRQVGRSLRRLREEGAVSATGARSARRYAAVDPPETSSAPRHPEDTEPAPAAPSDETVQRRRQEALDAEQLAPKMVMAVLEQDGPAPFGHIAARTKLNRGRVLTTLQGLARDNQVVQLDDRTWTTVARRDAELAAREKAAREQRQPRFDRLRTGIPAELARRPLTEVELTDRLEADREDVALICGELLEAGAVHLQPNGSYTLAPTQGGGREHVPTTTVPAALSRLQQAREQVTA